MRKQKRHRLVFEHIAVLRLNIKIDAPPLFLFPRRWSFTRMASLSLAKATLVALGLSCILYGTLFLCTVHCNTQTFDSWLGFSIFMFGVTIRVLCHHRDKRDINLVLVSAACILLLLTSAVRLFLIARSIYVFTEIVWTAHRNVSAACDWGPARPFSPLNVAQREEYSDIYYWHGHWRSAGSYRRCCIGDIHLSFVMRNNVELNTSTTGLSMLYRLARTNSINGGTHYLVLHKLRHVLISDHCVAWSNVCHRIQEHCLLHAGGILQINCRAVALVWWLPSSAVVCL